MWLMTRSTDCLVFPGPLLTPSIRACSSCIILGNFWTSRPSFFHLQDGDNHQLSFACIVRISWNEGRWRFFVVLLKLFCLFSLLLLISKELLWSWKDWLVQRKKQGLIEESDFPRPQSELEFWDPCPVLSQHVKFHHSVQAWFVHAQDLPSGRQKLLEGRQVFEVLNGMGEGCGVAAAAAGVEIPVHCLSCSAVTSFLGIWVLGESTGLWPRRPVVCLAAGWD